MPESDDKIWTTYAKGVKPIGKKKKQASFTRQKPFDKIAPSPAKTKGLLRKPEFSLPPPQGGRNASAVANPLQISFDRSVEHRLRRGAVEIEATLDLHGMRQAEAFEALNDFVARQIKKGHRRLLIITGRGRDGAGVLRANLAGWLAASNHAAYIIALRPAALKHGGSGASYILLRRRKVRDE
jgi:DNA-nicking Smr family endonuclease